VVRGGFLPAGVVRDDEELARWPIEDAPTERLVSDLTVTERPRGDGGSDVYVTWDELGTAARRHYMLRFTPDDGQTWIPLSSGFEGPQVEVDSELLRGIGSCRFQLAVSTGFRTTIVESTESIAGPPLARELTIIQPMAEAGVVQGDPVWLIGATAKRLGGRKDSVNAYWSSNRDGFLGDGLRVLVSTLSAGRHVLRLAVEDETDGEVTRSVSIWVQEQSAEPPAEEGGED
jgi:hypothetical protein